MEVGGWIGVEGGICIHLSGAKYTYNAFLLAYNVYQGTIVLFVDSRYYVPTATEQSGVGEGVQAGRGGRQG